MILMLGKLLIRDRMATQKRKRKKKYHPGLKNRKRLTMSPNQFLLLMGGQRLQKISKDFSRNALSTCNNSFFFSLSMLMRGIRTVGRMSVSV